MRPTPFDLVFRKAAQENFPRIRLALAQDGYDPRDRDRFLMVREVLTFLRELRPEEGLGEGIDQLAALLHHAYLFWDAGEISVELSGERLANLLGSAPVRDQCDAPPAYYAVVPEHRVWAQVIPGHPPEPLDGCFVHSGPGDQQLRVLGVFGIHPEREGFSVVEAEGARPSALARRDGSELFAPTLPGGKAAGLWSITGEEELLDIGWRTHEMGPAGWELGTRGSTLGVASSQLQAPST